jgi:hypothetical protein
VPRQLVDHPLAIDRVLRRMVQDVQPHQPGQQAMMLHSVCQDAIIGIRYRHSVNHSFHGGSTPGLSETLHR